MARRNNLSRQTMRKDEKPATKTTTAETPKATLETGRNFSAMEHMKKSEKSVRYSTKEVPLHENEKTDTAWGPHANFVNNCGKRVSHQSA